MSSVEILVVIATALAGGLVAHMIWRLVEGEAPSVRPAAAEQGAPRARARSAGAPPAEPVAEAISALRADIAQIARAQIALIEGQGERDTQLLSELRAIAGTTDPAILEALQRIEAALHAAEPGGTRAPDHTPPRPGADARADQRPPALMEIEGEPEEIFPEQPSTQRESLVSLLARARAEDGAGRAGTVDDSAERPPKPASAARRGRA